MGGAALNINGGKHGNPLAAAVEAIARGRADLEMLNVLMYHGADVNSTRGSSNALCSAAVHADLASMQSVIPILLERGANPNVSDSTGRHSTMPSGDTDIGQRSARRRPKRTFRK